jgi:phenylacetate-CoA ligase
MNLSYSMETPEARDFWRRAEPATLRRYQLDRLNRLLAETISNHAFYREKYRDLRLPLESLDELSRLPFLEKRELVTGGVATICGLPRSRYVRLHQTSGTTGDPLQLLDTPDDWAWWLGCWQYVLDAADVGPGDTALMAFSYGPFIGFWSAHDSCVARGATVVPGGGMDSLSRLKMIGRCGASLLCCTPTYALHLAGVAADHGIDIRRSTVSRIIVAGEPGGSIPAVRERIETAWGARVIDHCGATELGAWGVGSRDGRGVHVIESEFIAERIVFSDDCPGGRPAADGELAELVLTGLGRLGGPAIRYRTGDLVRGRQSDDSQNRFLYLDGGVVGRGDSMVVIRGVNVFPSSIDAIVRRVAGDAEYRVTQCHQAAMADLRVEIESPADNSAGGDDLAGRLATAFREHLGLRIAVIAVEPASLPRFEAKARRWVRETDQKSAK